MDLARYIVDVIEEMKGENILLLDLRGVTVIADFFVICSAASERQLKAIVQEVAAETKKKHGVHPFNVEGESGNGWVLMDYSAIVVHAFLPQTRGYYNLEEFWSKGAVVVNIQ